MPKRSPLIVRIQAVAELLGVSSDQLRHWCRRNRVPLLQAHAPGLPPAGPLYLTPDQAAQVALSMLGQRADESLRCALKRRARAQASSLGPRCETTAQDPGVPE